MKITALLENRAPGGLACEHGLSVHIACRGENILLDMGASRLFLQNAEALGVSLKTVTAAVLSHAHYDHSGGLADFLALNSGAPVYLRAGTGEDCYSKVGPFRQYIGIPRGVLAQNRERFLFVVGDAEISPGVWLLPHSTPCLQERGKRAHLYRQTEKRLLPDDFSHEQTLVLESTTGLVVLNSCSHAGADTVVEEVRRKFPDKEITAFIGGFHLMGLRGASSLGVAPEEVRTLAKHLDELGIRRIYTGHCTGGPAFALLREELGERVQYFQTGSVLTL